MELGVQCRIHKGSPIIPILSQMNPTPRIDTYLFKVHSNIDNGIYIFKFRYLLFLVLWFISVTWHMEVMRNSRLADNRPHFLIYLVYNLMDLKNI